MNILLIVVKATSTLDYALPLLWEIKRHRKDANISVLYCDLSRRKILRNSRFYSKVMNECEISEFDFADYLPHFGSLTRAVGRSLFSRSRRDSSVWGRRFRRIKGGRRIWNRAQGILNRVEKHLTGQIDLYRVLDGFEADVVLFDNRAVTSFEGRAEMYRFFDDAKKKVILLPHAPHHVWKVAFTPFDETGEALPDYCEFWMPFRFEETWKALPSKEGQFFHAGYPGLDSEWLAWLKSTSSDDAHSVPRLPELRTSTPLKCIMVTRPFLGETESRQPQHDGFIHDYAEFTNYMHAVGSALASTGEEIEILVKPHPSNDFQKVHQTLAQLRHKNLSWRIVDDSMYELMNQCDFVISTYSTVQFLPAMIGVPVLMMNSSTQDIVNREEDMKRLYTGFQFYADDLPELPVHLREMIEIAYERRQNGEIIWDHDIDHLRQFYPDGALKRCLDRLGILVSNNPGSPAA